ncbi:MAG: LuxR C-terminal-related transcriptional regulator [Flavobacterium sp.]
MNINILLTVDNEINRAGITTIITNEILSSNIVNVKKSELLKKISLKHFDIAIIEIKNFVKDFELIDYIIETDPKIKLFVISNTTIDAENLLKIKEKSVGVILGNSSKKNIVELINSSIQLSKKSRTPLRIRKKSNSQNLMYLLSERELEVALLLVNGMSITKISEKKNLAKTTISTYKKRIFEKTNVKNIIHMSELFKRQNNIILDK